MAKKLYYKIGEACKLLEIQPYVLRYWETEFQAMQPEKSKSGQRTYSERDLQLIARIKELLYEEGYTIAGAKKKLEAELDSGGSAALDRSSRKVAAAEEKSQQSAEDEPAPEPEVEPESSEEAKEAPVEQPQTVEPEPPKPRTKPKRKSRPKAPEPSPQTTSGQKVVKLRQGIQAALKEARRILIALESDS